MILNLAGMRSSLDSKKRTVCFILFCFLGNSLFSESFLNRFFPVDINAAERIQIEDLFKYISDLKPKRVVIDSKVYSEKSRFREFFGFPFAGPPLTAWLKHRISDFKMGASSEFYTANYRNGTVYLNRRFFQLSKLEQTVVLIHEARHADGADFQHVVCPKDFPYTSARAPEVKLEGLSACDDRKDGAYGFGAAFLFEIYSFGLLGGKSPEEILGLYRSETVRILLEGSKN